MNRSFRRRMAVLQVFLIAPCLLAAQSSMEGRWTGSINTPHGAIPLQLSMGHEGGEAMATYALTTAEGAQLQSVTSVRVAGDSIFVSLPLETNLGSAVMRMRGTWAGPALAGDFETVTDDGLTVGNGTWRLERAAPGGGGGKWLPRGAPVSTPDHHEGPSLFDEG